MKFIRKFFTGKKEFSGRSQHTEDNMPVGHENQTSYDLRDLYLLTEGNREYGIQLLELFLENAEKGLKQMHTACTLHNQDQASALAHKLIPGCNQLHISQLVWVLQQIENKRGHRLDSISLDILSNQALNCFYQVKQKIELELHKLKELPSPIRTENTMY